MLKVNTNKAKENTKTYIIKNFDSTNWGGCLDECNDFDTIATFIAKIFKEERLYIENIRYFHYNLEKMFADYLQGLPDIGIGDFWYHCTAVDDLGEILEETAEEKAKFTEQQAEEKLQYMIFKVLEKHLQKVYNDTLYHSN